MLPGEPWPIELPQRTDFWLFDHSVLYGMRYDQNNAWRSTERVTDPAAIKAARHWREVALRLAVPWRDYIAAHPPLARIVSETDLAAFYAEGAAGGAESAPCSPGRAAQSDPSGCRPIR